MKAFGLADLPQLTQPVSPSLGVLWLLDALLFLAATAAVFIWPRGWWAVGACAIVVSMFLIVPAWTDAKFGALGNLVADQGETVTMFNDMCVMAPATLIDPGFAWEPVDSRTARASFTNAGHTIRAELSFNEAGDLTNFWSDDRYQTSRDGTSVKKVRWSTPLADYRPFGRARLASGGEARWHEPGGDYAYIERTLDDVQYNVNSR